MSHPNILTEAFSTILKPANFKLAGDSWYRDGSDTIAIVNIQKSDYSNLYYVNIAIWLKELGAATKPKEYQCHIRLRWEELYPRIEKRLTRLLDLEDATLQDEARISGIQDMLSRHVLPFVDAAASLADLRELYGTRRWPNAMVLPAARKLLGSS